MSRLKLTDYDISMKTGFLSENPLINLPSYFEPWNRVSHSLLDLIEQDKLREEIQKMPVLDFTRLNGDKEIKLGHVQLTWMASCYLWHKGTDESQVPKVLPKSMAVPLYGLYEKYEIIPIISYADVVLNNYKIKDKSRPLDINNIAPMINIPGGEDWHWFVVTTTIAELAFAASIQSLQNLLDGIDETDEEKITRSLEEITDAVIKMKKASSLMQEKLPMDSFVKKIMQYFTGYGEHPLLDGLVFEGVNVEPVKMTGPNAGQTPIFKCLDIILDIKHQKDRQNHNENQYLYLSPKHRQFLNDLQKRPVRLRTLVETSSNQEMKIAFDKLVQAIVQFRTYHIQLVAKYMILALNKTLPPDQLEAVKPVKDFTVSYLKGMRDDSKQGKLSE